MADPTLRERFIAAMSKPGAIKRIFDIAETEAAFLPYWPEMLDFELADNKATEMDEIAAYREAFNG